MLSRPTRNRDHGSGLLSTSLGVTFFLCFMLLASHVLINLWMRSTVMHIADDAARDVAADPLISTNRPGVEEREISEARQLLGQHADNVRLNFEGDPTGQSVILHVQSDAAGVLANTDIGAIDTRIIIRIESR